MGRIRAAAFAVAFLVASACESERHADQREDARRALEASATSAPTRESRFDLSVVPRAMGDQAVGGAGVEGGDERLDAANQHEGALETEQHTHHPD